MIRTRCYRAGKLAEQDFALERLTSLVADPANTIWCDLCPPDDAALSLVTQALGLHTLAVKNVIYPGQRPKLEHYPEHLFLVAHMVTLADQGRQLVDSEVGVFVTRNAVVTVRADDRFDIDAVLTRWDEATHLAQSGVAFLLHGLLDYVVATHFDAVTELDSRIDTIEDRLFDESVPDDTLQRDGFGLRKSLVGLRRLALPLREVVNALMRRDLEVVDPATAPYFQDLYDQVLRVSEMTESLRDLLANIAETRLTLRGNRLNVIMKKVTSWAAIIAVPTAVTGFYGQNLPYPGFAQPWGFWFSTAFMLLASLALYITFKVKDWL